MVRQARSEATRRKIIDAAVDLFDEKGYQATGLGDIIDRLAVTKGALYYHFDSKESLATAIIEESGATLLEAFRGIGDSSAPALENVIHGVFVVVDLTAKDKLVRTGTRLHRGFVEFNDAAARNYTAFLTAMIARVKQANAEGDLAAGLDPVAVSETIVSSVVGAGVLTSAARGDTELVALVARVWEVLLPAIVTDESLLYFRQFLARESLRHSR
jgi:AcrR family transcriptional regulator